MLCYLRFYRRTEFIELIQPIYLFIYTYIHLYIWIFTYTFILYKHSCRIFLIDLGYSQGIILVGCFLPLSQVLKLSPGVLLHRNTQHGFRPKETWVHLLRSLVSMHQEQLWGHCLQRTAWVSEILLAPIAAPSRLIHHIYYIHTSFLPQFLSKGLQALCWYWSHY